MIFLTDRIFHMKSFPLFSGMGDGELAAIAAVMRERKYVPGETVCPGGTVPQKLMLATAGTLEFGDGGAAGGGLRPVIFGLTGLLFEQPPAACVVAGREQGFECLQISKSSFFTIIHECPGVLMNFLNLIRTGDQGSGVQAEII